MREVEIESKGSKNLCELEMSPNGATFYEGGGEEV